MLQFLLLAMMLAYVSAETPYISCLTSGDTIISFDLGGCTKSPCTFTRGTPIHAVVNFTSPIDSNSLNLYIYTENNGIPIAMTVRNECDDITPGCPLEEGVSYTSDAYFTIPKYARPGKAQLRGVRMGDYLEIITCDKLDVILV